MYAYKCIKDPPQYIHMSNGPKIFNIVSTIGQCNFIDCMDRQEVNIYSTG